VRKGIVADRSHLELTTRAAARNTPPYLHSWEIGAEEMLAVRVEEGASLVEASLPVCSWHSVATAFE